MDIRYKILEDREKRTQLIMDKIRDTNNYFVVIKGNICGDDKNIKEVNLILTFFLKEVLNIFNYKSYEKVNSYDGDYYIVELVDNNEIDIKKQLIDIESCDLGRFIDLDLFTGLSSSISRKDLNVIKRPCIVCGGDYNICSRERRHTLDEVLIKTKTLIRKGFVEKIVFDTCESLKEEVVAHPKFGLVTKKHNGKHKDMDYNTFLLSIDAIKPFLYKYAFEGFSIDDSTYKKLKNIGIEAEKAMFEATNGINTHKGIIFLLGFILPTIVFSIYNNQDFDKIQENVKFLSKDILKDFEKLDVKEKLTFGESIYINHGITGIRGEVHNGFKTAFDICNTYFQNYLEDSEINKSVINILLLCMLNLDDTVVLHNKDLKTLEYVKNTAREIIKVGSYNTNIGMKLIDEYTKVFIERNISPGGSADMVTVILLLMKIRRKFYI